jgi:hypothetical protein
MCAADASVDAAAAGDVPSRSVLVLLLLGFGRKVTVRPEIV